MDSSAARTVVVVAAIIVAIAAMIGAMALRSLGSGVALYSREALSISGSVDTGGVQPARANCNRYRVVALNEAALKAAAADQFNEFLVLLPDGKNALLCSETI